jgi:hypothetical protein
MSDTKVETEFSAEEEEFFRAGDAISAATPESAADELEPARTSMWSRLFKRKARGTEPPYLAPAHARATTGA